jgi:hypothetical protein
MAGKKASSGGRGSAKSTPVKQKQMKNKKACDVSSAPCSPAGRGTPRRAMANKAVERMKEMAVKTEDMDEDDAFDGDEDYDQAPTARGRTTPKKFKARVVNGSAPSTPMSKRYVTIVLFVLWRAWTHPSRHLSSARNRRERFLSDVSFFPAKIYRAGLAA